MRMDAKGKDPNVCEVLDDDVTLLLGKVSLDCLIFQI